MVFSRPLLHTRRRPRRTVSGACRSVAYTPDIPSARGRATETFRGKPLDAAAPLRAGSRAADVLHRSLAALRVIVVGRNSGHKRLHRTIPATFARLSKALWIRRHKLPLS